MQQGTNRACRVQLRSRWSCVPGVRSGTHPTLHRHTSREMASTSVSSASGHVAFSVLMDFLLVFRRGYADPVVQKFSRAKPHMNIGTIGMCARW